MKFYVPVKAIQKINPNAEFVVRGQDLETCEIEWLNGNTPITKETIQTKISEAEFDEKLEISKMETVS